MQLRPAIDVPATATRTAVAAVVVGPDVQARRRHLVADVLVAAGVVAETVDDQDRRPGAPAHAPPASASSAGQWRTSRSVPSVTVAWLTIDGMGAAYATRDADDRTRRYHAPMGVADGWVELGDRVFVRRYEFYDQNIGVVLGDGEALVIDTRSTYGQAREIQADLRELTTFPVTVVVDTHGHFDHAFGNAVFRPATIWGHERCVGFMRRTGERRKAEIAREEPSLAPELAEIVIDPPDRTFSDTATIEVGGRPLELSYLGRGHTDHDIVIAVPGTDVLFAGDLIESGNVPSFGDGYPLDWADTAAALVPRVTGMVVPGHGDHAGRAFAASQAASLASLVALARRGPCRRANAGGCDRAPIHSRSRRHRTPRPPSSEHSDSFAASSAEARPRSR